MDILVATREASRSAHRWRDAAAAFYESNQHGFAGHASRKKSAMYVLKEKGIAHLHRSGAARPLCRRESAGDGVNEYGDGGKACLHSRVHPTGAGRQPIPERPEVLLVPATRQRVKMTDVIAALSALPIPSDSN